MIIRFSVLSLFFFSYKLTASQNDDGDLPVGERVKYLKFELEKELKNKIVKKKPEKYNIKDDEVPSIINANYDYVDIAKMPITPINDHDERKIGDKYKLRQLATTTKFTIRTTRSRSLLRQKQEAINRDVQINKTPNKLLLAQQFARNPVSDEKMESFQTEPETETETESPASTISVLPEEDEDTPTITPDDDESVVTPEVDVDSLITTNLYQDPDQDTETTRTLNYIDYIQTSNKPVEIFYSIFNRHRRLMLDPSKMDASLQWTHCENLITPYLTGLKGCLSTPKTVGPTHRIILRLVYLLNTDVSKLSKQDIFSLLYQISNLQLRMYQWDHQAISALLNVITKGKRHTFHNIKRGFKEYFTAWGLDISNATNLLTQARLFRPPCINIPGQGEGSTKSSKSFRYTTSNSQTKCDSDAD